MPILTFYKNNKESKIDLFKINETAFAFSIYENGEINPLNAKRGIIKTENVLEFLRTNNYVIIDTEIKFVFIP